MNLIALRDAGWGRVLRQTEWFWTLYGAEKCKRGGAQRQRGIGNTVLADWRYRGSHFSFTMVLWAFSLHAHGPHSLASATCIHTLVPVHAYHTHSLGFTYTFAELFTNHTKNKNKNTYSRNRLTDTFCSHMCILFSLLSYTK